MWKHCMRSSVLDFICDKWPDQLTTKLLILLCGVSYSVRASLISAALQDTFRTTSAKHLYYHLALSNFSTLLWDPCSYDNQRLRNLLNARRRVPPNAYRFTWK